MKNTIISNYTNLNSLNRVYVYVCVCVCVCVYIYA